jgi:acetyltransferase-like isoleucine patch superfamily enzyme
MFFIKKILRLLLDWSKAKDIRRKITLRGANYRFSYYSHVSLVDGSVKEDIVLGDSVWMYGHLISEKHGKITFGDYSKLGENSSVQCVQSVEIGEYTATGDHVVITDNNTHSINPDDRLFMRRTPEDSQYRHMHFSISKPVCIGRNVWIGSYARICKGVKIGDNSVIAANAVVTRDIPPNSVAAGNPAVVVKSGIDRSPRLIPQPGAVN